MERLLESGKFGVEEDSSIAAKYMYMSGTGQFHEHPQGRTTSPADSNSCSCLPDVKYCLTPDQSTVIPVLAEW